MSTADTGWLKVESDDLAKCVGCGLCLPHCPTFRVTGEERYSPRGRIEAMRQVHEVGREADAAFLDVVDTCVQCRGCETACPSAVPFGHLMEGTREALVERSSYQPWWRRLGYRALGHHRLLLVGSTLLAIGQRLRVVPSARLGLIQLPIRREKLVASGDDVWLYTGCVMDAWQRDVHAAAKRVMEATGAGVALPASEGCCGALHVHAGLADDARGLAERTMASFPGDAPIVVDSAGCGAALKDYGRLLGTPEAERFAERVYDICEWLAQRLDDLPELDGPRPLVAISDPCHLRHVQRAHEPTRTVLGRVAEIVELDDEGLCCGAGGAFSALQPELARDIRQRKIDAISRSGAPLLAAANPGCAMHLASAGVAVRHPIEFVADALEGHGR